MFHKKPPSPKGVNYKPSAPEEELESL